jgi:hypothetical protein
MPFLKKISHSDYTIGLWSISGNSDELTGRVSLSEQEQTMLESFSSNRRRYEFLAVRKLLAELLGSVHEIQYSDSGQPQISGLSSKISISHSASLAAVIISGNYAGIDVEEKSRNIEKVAGRFLSDEEIEWTKQSADIQLSRLICWCAKETLYKMANQSMVEFSRHINIFPFDLNDFCFTGRFDNGNIDFGARLEYKIIDNNVVVWSVNR